MIGGGRIKKKRGKKEGRGEDDTFIAAQHQGLNGGKYKGEIRVSPPYEVSTL